VSNSQKVAYFGRSWKLQITPHQIVPDATDVNADPIKALTAVMAQSPVDSSDAQWTLANSDWSEESLKITFECTQKPLVTYWQADIVIYNFAPSLRQVIRAGDDVVLNAGYQVPGMGVVFRGKVFQPIWEKQNETDYTLTLHCLVALWVDQLSFVSITLPSLIKRGDAVKLVAQQAGAPVEYLDPALQLLPTNPRAEAFSGRASKFFAQVARDAGLNIWTSWNGLNIRSLAPQGTTPDIVYVPPYGTATAAAAQTKYTLIGTPEQTEDGILFAVLMDSDVSLGMLVAVSALIKQVPLTPGQKAPLNPNGVWVVASITHRGDTRGNMWLTEIHAITRDYSSFAALMSPK
jgi:hypothetical protein